MNSRDFANPRCQKCSGLGQIATGPLISDWKICTCAMLNQRQASAQLLLKNTLPKKALTMTLSSYNTGDLPQNQRAVDAARNFVDNYQEAADNGWIIGFWGEPRAGKTHLAVGIIQAIAKRYGARPMLLNLPKAMTAERERFNNPQAPSPLAAAKSADILVIDDLGAEYERQGGEQRVSWLTEQLYQLVDERFMYDRPTIYTTNLSPSEMSTRYSGEAWKRILARIEAAQVAALEVLRTERRAIDEQAREKILSPRQ